MCVCVVAQDEKPHTRRSQRRHNEPLTVPGADVQLMKTGCRVRRERGGGGGGLIQPCLYLKNTPSKKKEKNRKAPSDFKLTGSFRKHRQHSQCFSASLSERKVWSHIKGTQKGINKNHPPTFRRRQFEPLARRQRGPVLNEAARSPPSVLSGLASAVQKLSNL